MSNNGLLRFLTCGSVDDGKSTLIGRLLFDCKAILADTLDALATTSRRRGLTATDLSLLTDGLQAEREQGITIDVAYRYFSTGTRKYILADAPGHEQYTRNMVTAASTADLAIVLVDARKGVLQQTRRHMTLAHLMGLRPLVVAVNKMDLVGYRQETFQDIRRTCEAFAHRLGVQDLVFIPLSALEGDMVVERGPHMAWYSGPTLLDLLETVEVRGEDPVAPFRFPVQGVCRPRKPEFLDYRGYQGRVEAGRVAVGDAVRVLPSGLGTRIRRIETYGGDLEVAQCGQSVTLHLEDELDVARGDLLVAPAQAPAPLRELTATLCWLGERPLTPGRRLLLRHGPREVRAEIREVLGRLDLESLRQVPAGELAMNDIATVRLRLHQPIAPDPYAHLPRNGGFILVDETTFGTVAAGLVLPDEAF